MINAVAFLIEEKMYLKSENFFQQPGQQFGGGDS